MTRTRVTGAMVEAAVALTAEALRGAPEEAWGNRAGPMDSDCWDTLDHLNNCVFSYAMRLAPPVPEVWKPSVLWDRGGERPFPLTTDRKLGPEPGLAVLLGAGGLVSAVVETRPDSVRAFHIWGTADPEGFAAMGVVETLAHAFDIATGLGVAFTPPAELVAPALARLFPEAPTDTDPWPTLLWATGRGELDGYERRGSDWTWHGAPLSE